MLAGCARATGAVKAAAALRARVEAWRGAARAASLEVSVDHAVGVHVCDAERELYQPKRDGKLVEGAFSIVARDQAVERAACVVKCAGASTHGRQSPGAHARGGKYRPHTR